MIFRLDRFFFDEKDIFIGVLGVFLLVSLFLGFDLAPFRRESLLVLFVFLAVTRSLISQQKMTGYAAIALAGILFSLFISPYGLAIYLFIATIVYIKFV